MELKLQGVSRKIHEHTHTVHSARWTRRKELKMIGTLNELSLGGDFELEVIFTADQIMSGVKKLIQLDPEKALLMINELQAHSIIELNKPGTIDATDG